MEPTALVEALVSLSDHDRLEFARWAVRLPRALADRPEWGNAYIARSVAGGVAARAFDALRNDGSVPHPPPWEFAFDPCFPETGWEAWRAAEAMVRAIAAALASGDDASLADLEPAFERLGLASAFKRTSG